MGVNCSSGKNIHVEILRNHNGHHPAHAGGPRGRGKRRHWEGVPLQEGQPEVPSQALVSKV